MQKELQEQFEKGLENEKLISVLKKASDFDETQYKIIVKVLKDYTFSFIDQNFIGKKEVREKIENIKCDYPKSSSQKEHQINIEIIERTVNQIREELLKQTK